MKMKMSGSGYEKYLVRKPVYERCGGIKNRQSPAMTYMSSAQVPVANCYLEYSWIYGIPEPNPPVSEHTHNTEEIILYIGGDPKTPEDLGGEIEMFVGGQPLTFSTAVALFVPRGLRHGPVIWKKFNKPHIEMTLILGAAAKDSPLIDHTPEVRESSSEEWKNVNYEKYLVRRPIGERAIGIKNRQSPAMTYMSSAQVPEADYYIEYGWIYGIPEPNPPVSEHVHDHDEIILHFGGDPWNPEDLGGEIEFMVEGKPLLLNTNTAFFAPKGLTHCPVTWKKFIKPHIEMAITLGSGKR
jgi:hypothetical protein